MSHADYLAPLDEDQLERLIELAQQRLSGIREGGCVTLWVVAVGGACVAFFRLDEYREAVSELQYLGMQKADSGKEYELALDTGRYRPEEAAEVLRSTQAAIQRRTPAP